MGRRRWHALRHGEPVPRPRAPSSRGGHRRGRAAAARRGGGGPASRTSSAATRTGTTSSRATTGGSSSRSRGTGSRGRSSRRRTRRSRTSPPPGCRSRSRSPVPALDGSLIVAGDDVGRRDPRPPPRDVHRGRAARRRGVLLAPAVLRAHGAMGAELALALAGFDHPGLDRAFQWDLRYAADICEALAPFASTPERRALLDASIARAMTALEPLIPRAPGPGRPRGHHRPEHARDARRGRAPRCRPGSSTSATSRGRGSSSRPRRDDRRRHDVRHRPTRCGSRPRSRAATRASLPLTDAELAALWPLVVARAASVAISGDHQASLEPDNAYVIESRHAEWAALEAVAAVPFALATEALREAAGLGPVERPIVKRAVAPVLADAPVPMALDLSTTLGCARRVRDRRPGRGRAARRGGGGGRVHGRRPVGRGAARRHGARRDRRGADDPPRDRPVRAGRHGGPRAGRAASSGGSTAGSSSAGSRTSSSRASSRRSATAREVGAGDAVGTVAAAGPDGLPTARPRPARRGAGPRGAPPRRPVARRRVAPAVPGPVRDPRPRAGCRGRRRDDPAALLARRDAVLATTQEHYFDAPPRIERGWRHHLVDTRGRARVDIVNNVAVLGHSHPAVEAAVARQLRLLNTNSRFLYEPMVAFAEALAARFPAPLDTVFLVNTGSESVELAIRLARTATGQRGRHRDPRRVPRLDRRDRRHHDLRARQPASARDAAGVGPRGRGTQPVARPLPRARTPAPATPTTCGGSSPSSRRPAAARPRSSPRRCSATRAASCSPTATCARPTRPCGPRAGSSIADEVQVGYGRLGRVPLGVRAAGRACRTS